MKIERFPPSAILAPYIREFMVLETDLDTGNTIIPDTSIVLALRIRGRVLDGRETADLSRRMDMDALPLSAISGLRKSARRICYTAGTANLLIVFKEGGITAFGRVPAHELFNLSIPADNFFPSSELNELLEKIAEAEDNASRIAIVETFFQDRLSTDSLAAGRFSGKALSGFQPYSLVGEAIGIIKRQGGVVRIRDLTQALHISQDAFEKKFRNHVGASPRQFASIVRLRNLIARYSSFSSLTDASYEAGYFDQSHFIKDFRLFTGQAPKDFFRTTRFW